MARDSAPPASSAHPEAPPEGESASPPLEATDATTGGAETLKRPPEAEAKQLKQLAKEKNAVKPVSDSMLGKEIDLEIEVDATGEKHTYRRKQSDGSWCRFSKRDCGYWFDPEDHEAINRMAAGDFSRSAALSGHIAPVSL